MGNQLLYGPNQVAEFPQAGPQYANDATPKNIPGRVIQYKGKKYRYVQIVTGDSTPVTPVAGGSVYWKELDPSTGTFVASTDETDSIAGINGLAGILELADVPTDEYYTWIQVGGVADPLVNAGTAAGTKMTGSATDSVLDHVDVGGAVLDNIFGIAHDARDTAGTAKVLLQNLDW
jgi:hypothetical protein